MAETREIGVKQAWSTLFYQRVWSHHSAEVAKLVEHIYRLKDRQREAIESQVATAAKSASGLYESQFDFFDDPHPELQQLVGFIRETIAIAVSHANRVDVPPESLSINFSDSWYHITQDGGFHDAHVHTGCSWCGIYYLQLGDYREPRQGETPNGGSRFYSPLPLGGQYQDFGNKYLSDVSLDPPLQEGLLILFPSYLLHSGLPYRGKTDRIVLALNAQIHVQ